MGGYAIGIDIGGTKLAAGLFERSGCILARAQLPTGANCRPEQVVDAAAQAVDALLKETGLARDEIDGTGVGCAGHIDYARGLVLANSNLPGWRCHPLRDLLQARLGLPVVLDNDANCAAWGEFRLGAGRGARHMCYLTFSTGCGMGIVIDRRLYRGATGTAGEIGHTVVNPDGPRCSCGKRGCLMSYACGMALDEMARGCIECGEETLLKELCGECPQQVKAEQVAEAARQGDAVALRLLEIAGRYFGIGLSTVVQVLNPDTIVIGGGLAHIGPLLLHPCQRAMNEYIHPVLAGSAQVKLSELWHDAGLLGAGLLVWDETA
ncbi:MAG TPA: ROK family protein [Levilinea sp.]|nr:ROK family protein [Levilinea sp.]